MEVVFFARNPDWFAISVLNLVIGGAIVWFVLTVMHADLTAFLTKQYYGAYTMIGLGILGALIVLAIYIDKWVALAFASFIVLAIVGYAFLRWLCSRTTTQTGT